MDYLVALHYKTIVNDIFTAIFSNTYIKIITYNISSIKRFFKYRLNLAEKFSKYHQEIKPDDKREYDI